MKSMIHVARNLKSMMPVLVTVLVMVLVMVLVTSSTVLLTSWTLLLTPSTMLLTALTQLLKGGRLWRLLSPLMALVVRSHRIHPSLIAVLID
jgi:hypothetical protein